jgi:predicted phosphodiesterase
MFLMRHHIKRKNDQPKKSKEIHSKISRIHLGNLLSSKQIMLMRTIERRIIIQINHNFKRKTIRLPRRNAIFLTIRILIGSCI